MFNCTLPKFKPNEKKNLSIYLFLPAVIRPGGIGRNISKAVTHKKSPTEYISCQAFFYSY